VLFACRSDPSLGVGEPFDRLPFGGDFRVLFGDHAGRTEDDKPL
jgi:hypothetical protein